MINTIKKSYKSKIDMKILKKKKHSEKISEIVNSGR